MKTICFGILVMFCEPMESPKSVTVVCPPLIEWSADLQRRAAAELRALPFAAASRQLIARAIEQRDVNRRCKATKR